MRGCLGFVESAPVLAELIEIKLREARERLPATRNISKGAAHRYLRIALTGIAPF
jgi:hypothetical protein